MGFTSPRTMIGLENLRHPLNQSIAKLKPTASWSLKFSRALGWLHVLILGFHRQLVILPSFLFVTVILL